MYDVSTDYLTALSSGVSVTNIEILVEPVTPEIPPFTLRDGDIEQGSFSVNRKAVSGNELEIGAVYAAEIHFNILKSEIDRFGLYDAKVTVTHGLRLPDGTFEIIPIGVFYVAEANRISTKIEITGYDIMPKFDDPALYNENAFDGNVYDVLLFCATKLGLQIGQTQEEVEALPNGTYYIGLDQNDVIQPRNWRDVLSFLAAFTCSSAQIDRNGGLVLRAFKPTSTEDWESNRQRASSTVVSDFILQIRNIYYTIEGELQVFELDPSKWNDKAAATNYTVPENPFIDNLAESARLKILQSICDNLGAVAYTPYTLALLGAGCPHLDCGDNVKVYTNKEMTEWIISPVMVWNYTFKGGSQIQAVGNLPLLKKNTVEASITNQIKEETNKSEYDFISYTNAGEILLPNSPTQDVVIANLLYRVKKQSNVVLVGKVQIDVGDYDKPVGYDPPPPVEGEEPPEDFIPNKNEAVLMITYEDDDIKDNVYIPITHLATEGKRFVQLLYPILNPIVGMTHTLKVYMRLFGADGLILRGKVKIVLQGSGLAAGAIQWRGQFEIADNLEEGFDLTPYIGNIDYGAITLGLTPMTETIVQRIEPIMKHAITDNLGSGYDLTKIYKPEEFDWIVSFYDVPEITP